MEVDARCVANPRQTADYYLSLLRLATRAALAAVFGTTVTPKIDSLPTLPHSCRAALRRWADTGSCNARSGKLRRCRRRLAAHRRNPAPARRPVEPALQMSATEFSLGVLLVAGTLQWLLVFHLVVRQLGGESSGRSGMMAAETSGAGRLAAYNVQNPAPGPRRRNRSL